MTTPLHELAQLLGIDPGPLNQQQLMDQVCSAALMKIKELDSAVLEEIEIRDNYHAAADMLANEISRCFGVDIGEHTNCNNPWVNAFEVIPNSKAIAGVISERRRQDEKWGGPEHDDQHTPNEFVQLIQDYAGWARVMAGMNSPEKARRRLIQVAALAVAAVECYDRAAERAGGR